MAEIGEPQKEITVEPVTLPERKPAEKPIEKPAPKEPAVPGP